jgi:catechol 2,3-dioxygenase-like lactoylglutathione lyase family enzyme
VKTIASSICLIVDDIAASAGFLSDHFGFEEVYKADGMVTLAGPEGQIIVAFLQRGMDKLREDQRHAHASGLILAFTVDDVESEYVRLQAEGVAITKPLHPDAWGGRAFQVRDPNGLILEVLDLYVEQK